MLRSDSFFPPAADWLRAEEEEEEEEEEEQRGTNKETNIRRVDLRGAAALTNELPQGEEEDIREEKRGVEG